MADIGAIHGKAVKVILITLLFAVPVFAKDQPSRIAPACGPENGGFDVSLNESHHTLALPETGMARVYFIQDLGPHNYIGEVFVGLDGAWVGANKDNSYFSLSVVPGKHHLCENVKSHFSEYGRLVELASFTAEAGKAYYFRARLVVGENNAYLFLDPIDIDEARHLIATYPLSVSHAKK